MNHSKMLLKKNTGTLAAHMSIFRNNERGAAAIEFAFVMPLLILLYFGTVDGSRMLAFDRRLTSASATLGDLVARTKTSLTTAELGDFFTAAQITMTPYDADQLEQVITCVYVDASGNSTVVWSYGNNGGTAHTVSSSYPLPVEFTDIASDTYVIVSETALDYEPLTNLVFGNAIGLYKEQYYIPRFGGLISVI